MVVTRRAYKLRFYPTLVQERALACWFGHTRWVWNWALDARRKAYVRREETLTSLDLDRTLRRMMSAPGHAWLRDVPNEALTQKLRDLDTAYRNFFEGRARFPRFKSRRGRQSARVRFDSRHAGKVRAWVTGTDERPHRHLVLPKLGAVKLRGRAVPVAMPKMVTVSRDQCGRYWASFSVEEAPRAAPAPTRVSIGVDAGARRLATLSDGTKFENPRALARYARQLSTNQKRLARQCRGSNRRAKTRERIARIPARITHCRREALHRVTSSIVHESQVICIETLGVAELTRSAKGTRRRPGVGVKAKSRLNRSLLDASMAELLRQLEYKAGWYGRTCVAVDREFPSSGLCHACGEVNHALTIDETEWTCEVCATHHDRDENAAINIEADGLRSLTHPEDTGTAGGLPPVCAASLAAGA